MRIILIIISFILIAEAGHDTFLGKNQPFIVFAIEGAAEEELPLEKDNLNQDTQFLNQYIYYNGYTLKKNYSLAFKYPLNFISHSIFSPPPNVI